MTRDLFVNLAAALIFAALGAMAVRARNFLRLRTMRRAIALKRPRSREDDAVGLVVAMPTFWVESKGWKPARDESTAFRVMRDKDVLSVSLALDFCRQLQVKTELTAGGRTHSVKTTEATGTTLEEQRAWPSVPDAPNIYCVASWSGNALTDYFLTKCCPGFVINNRENEQENFDSISYTCDNYTFKDNAQTAWAFVVHISPRQSVLNKNVILAFGHHGEGTRAAVEFISKEYRSLAARDENSYFLAFRIDQQSGQISDSAVTDITRYAFMTPAGNT